MTELSPAAQAVLDAYWNYPWDPARQHEDRGSIAAVLRAAADQLGQDLEFYNTRMVATRDLLALADELEAQ